MFEFDQDIIDTLLDGNREFKHLYQQHHDLKEKVKDAESGALPMDSLTLGAMKKEKLLVKDKLTAMVEQYRRDHAPA